MLSISYIEPKPAKSKIKTFDGLISVDIYVAWIKKKKKKIMTKFK